jgi:hypothetical protein
MYSAETLVDVQALIDVRLQEDMQRIEDVDSQQRSAEVRRGALIKGC